MNSRLISFLEILKRGRQIAFGLDRLKDLKAKDTALIIVLSSASERTKKEASKIAKRNDAPLLKLNSSALFENETTCRLSVITVLNKNANQKIFSLLKEGDTYE